MDLTILRTRAPSRLDRSHMTTQEKPSIEDVYHHGVKGMKWGVRHDRKRLGRRRASSKSEESSTGKTGFQLTDKQKRALKIGAGIAAGVLVAYGGYKLNEMGAFDSLKSAGQAASATASFDFGSTKAKVGRSIDEIDVGMVSRMNAGNPGPEGDINCTHNAIGYVLNSVLGHNVTAKGFGGVDEVSGRVAPGRDRSVIDAVFEGVQHRQPPHTESFESTMAQIPNGSTGVLALVGAQGHVLNYEKDSRGQVTLVDCQAKDSRLRVVQQGSAVYRHISQNVMVADVMDCSNVSVRDSAKDFLGYMVKGYDG